MKNDAITAPGDAHADSSGPAKVSPAGSSTLTTHRP